MQEIVNESQQPSVNNFNPSQFNLTNDQYLYIQKYMPKGYSIVDIKTKKVKKDPIFLDGESHSQSIQAARNSSRRVPSKDNSITGSAKKIEVKKYPEEEPIIKPKPIVHSHGLSSEQTAYYQSVLAQIKKHKNAYPFLVPVDPIQLEIPDYFQVIKTPMDLQTIEKRLKQKHYQSGNEFINDLNQIWVNSYSYNPKGSDMYVMTTEMQKFCSKLLVKPPVQPVKQKQISLPPPSAPKKIMPPKQAQTSKQSKKSKPPSKQIIKIMTAAQKKQLKSDIELLPFQYLGGVWEIIAKNRQDDETVFDLNNLEFDKLKRLDSYCKDVLHFKKKEERKVVEQPVDVHEIDSSENSSFLLESQIDA